MTRILHCCALLLNPLRLAMRASLLAPQVYGSLFTTVSDTVEAIVSDVSLAFTNIATYKVPYTPNRSGILLHDIPEAESFTSRHYAFVLTIQLGLRPFAVVPTDRVPHVGIRGTHLGCDTNVCSNRGENRNISRRIV